MGEKRFTFLDMEKIAYLFHWIDLLDNSRFRERKEFTQDEIQPYIKRMSGWNRLEECTEDLIITEEMEIELNKN
jgi:hypothetical protein